MVFHLRKPESLGKYVETFSMNISQPRISLSGTLLPAALFCLWLLLQLLFLHPVALAQEDKEPVTIAGIYAVTGLAATSNAPPIVGARLAVQDINSSGGVLGRELRLVLLDNKSTPIGSSLAVRQAQEAGAVAIVGPSWSSHALAAGKQAQKLRIPLCSDVATNPAVTLVGDCVFRACFTDVFQSRVLAHFARNTLGLRKLGSIVNVSSDYSIGLDALFRKYFTQLGGEMTRRATYKTNVIRQGEGLNDLLNTLTPFDMQALFIPGHRESDAIVQALVASGFSGALLGGDGWESDDFRSMQSIEKQGAYYCGHWSPQWDTPRNKVFMERYGNKLDITSGLVLAYDAVHLLAEAIEKAGSTEREDIRKALAQTRNFQGVTGSISFDANGDPVKNAVMMQVQQGKPVYLQTVTSSEVSF